MNDDTLDIVERSAAELCERIEYFSDSRSAIAVFNDASDSISQLLRQKYADSELVFVPDFGDCAKTRDGSSKASALSDRLKRSALPSESDFADLAVANLISSTPALLGFFNESLNLVRSGAMMMFSMFGAQSFRQLKDTSVSLQECDWLAGFPDLHDVGDLMVSAGTSNPIVDVDSMDYRFSSIETLLKELKQTGLAAKVWRDPDIVDASAIQSELMQNYETSPGESSSHCLTVEVIYGICFKSPQREDSAEVKVVFDSSQYNEP